MPPDLVAICVRQSIVCRYPIGILVIDFDFAFEFPPQAGQPLCTQDSKRLGRRPQERAAAQSRRATCSQHDNLEQIPYELIEPQTQRSLRKQLVARASALA